VREEEIKKERKERKAYKERKERIKTKKKRDPENQYKLMVCQGNYPRILENYFNFILDVK